MARIESERQRDALKVRFDQLQGALALHQELSQHVNDLVKGYLENVALVAGIEIQDGDRVTVDWNTSEVTVESTSQHGLEQLVPNGVAT